MSENSLSSAIQQLLAALPEIFPGVQLIPLKNIRPNPDNPGAPITEDQIKELGENMQAKGLLNSIRVNPDRTNPLVGSAQPHPDNFRIKADGRSWELGDFNFIVLTGENRYRAALWLKWETINGNILNPTAKEAVILNHLDNDVRERGWWAAYQSIEQLIKADPNLTQREIKTELKLDLEKVNRALGLLPLLNSEARALIVRSANNSNKGNRGISERAAARLADLGPGTGLKRGTRKKDPDAGTSDSAENASASPSGVLWPYPAIPPETQDLVYRTLVVACDHQMTEAQVARLVEKVQAGIAPESVDSQQVAKPKPTHPAHAHLSATGGLSLSGAAASHQTNHTQAAPAPSTEPESQPSNNWFWKWMVGIRFISQMRSKVKKDETLTTTEKLLLSGYKAWMFFAPARKEFLKLLKEMVKGFWDSVKKALGKTAKSILDFVLPLIFIVLLIWGILAFFHFAVISPLHWIENKIGSIFHADSHNESAQSSPASQLVASTQMSGGHSEESSAVPTPNANGNINKPLAQPNLVARLVASQQAPKKKIEKTTPAATYQPAVSFAPSPSETLYDPKILESEIQSLPVNCVVKDYPMTPDEGMPGDVAVSRMQDLIDPDKYTMLIGSGKQTIKLVSPTNTTLTIQYKSTDLFNVLGGDKSPMNFLWEDVKYIHTNEIDVETKTPSVIYQCSLVVSGSKYPLTIQCAAAEDLEHLVSTMQYFIRSSRLGRDTVLAGMPYPLQGLRLNKECRVEKIWTNSPASNAVSPMETAQPNHVTQLVASQQVGLQWGDHLWSIGKETKDQQEKKDFEKVLQSSLPVTLFAVSSADWTKAQIAAGVGNAIHPKLKKVTLTTF